VFYFIPHWGDLAVVQRLEYALDTGWGDAIFISEDRSTGFAVKIGSYGSVLCTARIFFWTAAKLLWPDMHLSTKTWIKSLMIGNVRATNLDHYQA